MAWSNNLHLHFPLVPPFIFISFYSNPRPLPPFSPSKSSLSLRLLLFSHSSTCWSTAPFLIWHLHSTFQRRSRSPKRKINLETKHIFSQNSEERAGGRTSNGQLVSTRRPLCNERRLKRLRNLRLQRPTLGARQQNGEIKVKFPPSPAPSGFHRTHHSTADRLLYPSSFGGKSIRQRLHRPNVPQSRPFCNGQPVGAAAKRLAIERQLSIATGEVRRRATGRKKPIKDVAAR